MVKIVGYLEDSLIVFLRGKFRAYEEPREEKNSVQQNKKEKKRERRKKREEKAKKCWKNSVLQEFQISKVSM